MNSKITIPFSKDVLILENSETEVNLISTTLKNDILGILKRNSGFGSKSLRR